jgi:hypothetical protein
MHTILDEGAGSMIHREEMKATALFKMSMVIFSLITIVTAILTPMLVTRFYPLPPDSGSAWYFWQLASSTKAARVSYWLGFALHLTAAGWILFKGRQVKPEDKNGITKYNLMMYNVNIVFVLLHLLQTHIWYDGLAKDVPIWTSQGSVIVMLIFILYLMIPVRGLFWGRKFAPPKKMLELVKRWHGPYISLALIYTFWFHPMEGNWGLLSGFIYMFLLFTQQNLFKTRIHYSKSWIVLLEFFVVIHGTLITVYKEMEIWPMFLFGFLVMFFLTQIHTWKLKPAHAWSALAGFILSILLVYGFVRGFSHVYEVLFIPVALYGGAGALLIIGYLWDRAGSGSGSGSGNGSGSGSGSGSGNGSGKRVPADSR